MSEILIYSQIVAPHPMTNINTKAALLGNLIKRAFDVLIALLGLTLGAPILGYIALRIKRDSAGPVYYRGERVGRGGKVFQILKFRTMYERPESYQGPRVTAEGDPRITPYGKWLRETKLNELPQLWNVLKGEMSLVGPRPEDPQIVAGWAEDVRQEVLSVRPGITSPASVIYRNEEGLLQNGQVMDFYVSEILPSKLRLDQLYVRHRSFWSDLDIIFWTLLALPSRLKAYSPSGETFFVGPVAQLMRHHVSWFVADTLVTFLALGLTGLFWRSFGPLDMGWLPAIFLAVGFAVLFSLVNASQGVNRIDWSRAAASDALDLLPGAALATLIALLINYFFPASLLGVPLVEPFTPWGTRALLPPGLILMGAALAFLGFAAVRYRGRLVTGLATRWVVWRGPVPASQERMLIIGGGETGQFAAWMLSNGHYSRNLKVVGFVDDDLYKQGTRIRGIHVLGRRTDIPTLVEKHDIGILVFAIHNILPEERHALLEICRATRARVLLFPDLQAALIGISQNADLKRHATPDQSGSSTAQAAVPPDGLPHSLYETDGMPLRLDDWLAELENSAQAGNVDEVLAQIHQLRKHISSDINVQQAEHSKDQ
jgi:lipopolysaccharide/colanic/teichoic acid biosynthesis glycosyltransferase